MRQQGAQFSLLPELPAPLRRNIFRLYRRMTRPVCAPSPEIKRDLQSAAYVVRDHRRDVALKRTPLSGRVPLDFGAVSRNRVFLQKARSRGIPLSAKILPRDASHKSRRASSRMRRSLESHMPSLIPNRLLRGCQIPLDFGAVSRNRVFLQKARSRGIPLSAKILPRGASQKSRGTLPECGVRLKATYLC